MKQAKEFLSALFEHATRPCVVSYANVRDGKHKPAEMYDRSGAKIIKFIEKHDIPGRAVYACVSDVPHGNRSKQNVGVTLAAFADLDFKGIAHPRTAIEEAIALLPVRPSFVIFTGNGLHLWWIFVEPVADHDRVERLLRHISDVLAGDRAVCEVSRVMRVPDTHNTKNGANHTVEIIERNAERYPIERLEEYFEFAMPLLLRVKRVNNTTREPVKLSAWEQYARDAEKLGDGGERINHDELWGNLVYYGEGCGGNVNTTIRDASSSLLSRGVPVEDAIEEIQQKLLELIPEASDWDWEPGLPKSEIDKLRGLCASWFEKNPELLDWQEHKPRWLVKKIERTIKKREAELHGHGPGNGALNGSGKANGAHPPPLENNAPAGSPEGVPYDLWNKNKPPPLPPGLLPPIIERFVRARAVQMGSDPSGLAMAALCAAGAAIPDSIQIQVKVNDPYWLESARLWVALVGSVSALKSPVFKEAMRALKRIDTRLVQESAAAHAAWEEGGKEGPEPPRHRIVLNDPTVEAVGEIAKDNPDGMMYARDELSGMLGSIEKYAARGAGADRGFYLSAFNGEDYTFDRIKRGSGRVEHLGLSILGGIQPDTIRKYDDIGADDGLVQRFNPVIIEDSTADLDVPMPPDAKLYDDLIERLHNMPRQMFGCLKFTPEAQKIREMNAAENIRLRDGLKSFNTKFAGHLGKYNGMFARLCVIFHCIENKGVTLPDVDAELAMRVHRFMHEFLIRHAAAFYFGVLGVADNNDKLLSVAGYILANPKKFKDERKMVTNRDVQQSTRSMRGLGRIDIEKVFHNLDTLNWVARVAPKRAGDPPSWSVNPKVFDMFKDRAEQEKIRREDARVLIEGLSTVGAINS